MDPGKSNEAASSPRHHNMVGGNGPNSYVRNSQYQKELVISAADLIQELISNHLDTGKCHQAFGIADFGCSVGPNTYLAVENIIAAVENKYLYEKSKKPDFHVFFNDLISNDFNMLFQNLPSSRNYFPAAVPGTFHARLFPEATLHFAHCSTALHWLSRVPEKVTNKGRIHYLGADKEVQQAYSDQYKEDMGAFLCARASELIHGGLMALILLGFPDEATSTDSSIGMAFDIFSSCLRDMACLGKIDQQKVDSFNLPFYYPFPSELRALIEVNGAFQIEKISPLAAPMRHKPDPRVLTSHFRAVIGVLVEEHLGDGLMVEELFQRYYEKLLESPIMVDDRFWKDTNYLVCLKRKN